MSPAAPHIAVSAAMNSELLFAPFFRGSSWDRWRSVLKAFAGESLTADELELFQHVADRDPPTKAARELVAVAGRGGGKDSIAQLLRRWRPSISSPRASSGQARKLWSCLACDRAQASIVYDYIHAYFDMIPALKKMVVVRRQRSDNAPPRPAAARLLN